MLYTSRLFLRPVLLSDLTDEFVSWLNDPETNQYLETRFIPQSLETLHDYWHSQSVDQSSYWLAICLRHDSNRHIGNIKIGPIHRFHRCAALSLFIGDKCCRGKGYACEAIDAICNWAFTDLSVEKLSAGIYSSNQASIKAFSKCGFTLEGTLKGEVVCQGRRIDVLRMGLSKTA